MTRVSSDFAAQMRGSNGKPMKVYKSFHDAIDDTTKTMVKQHDDITGRVRLGMEEEGAKLAKEMKEQREKIFPNKGAIR